MRICTQILVRLGSIYPEKRGIALASLGTYTIPDAY